ncbi:MAG: toll/interleukin-1 receptor domain-containing protein, partial [Limisphaerales bacterium]
MKAKSSPGGPAGTVTSAPIRIYVLWHPRFTRGETIANEIYRWFRLENMEGIPVFFRSTPAPDSEIPRGIGDDCRLNYLLPLVEAHMVADPSWRQYVLRLAERPEIRLFPVALDPLAFQMPAKLRGLNFIRHPVTEPTPQSTEILLGHLTEILCRDLLALETPSHPISAARGSAVPHKVKLFLSHAKADGTEVPVRLKDYIQTHTQCETFFDETDIASGHEYATILEDAIRHESAGMITIQGDHYAERPWCRREIRRFQRPWPEPAHGPAANLARAFFVPPLVVVQNMSGKRISRTIPELGQAPCLRWTEGGERAIVTTLLREVLLGLFYRRLAREACQRYPAEALVVNRAPDPVMMQQLINDPSIGKPPTQVLYPGYGLSQLEKDGLEYSFPKISFQSLSEDHAPDSSLARLAGRVLRLGVGNATDILSGGLSDDHNRELLIRLLRPLCRNRVSILYGGALPRPEYRPRVNFTETCLHLLLSERSSTDHKGEQTARLYSIPAWPDSETVTERTIAEWTDVCSFRRVQPDVVGLQVPPDVPPDPVPDPADYPTGAERRQFLAQHAKSRETIVLARNITQARCLSFMRAQCCGPIGFPIADRPDDHQT